MSYTNAILLRRTDFGDKDLILTLFTKDRGKTSVIAKSAKTSCRRFAGTLDLFTVSQVLYKKGRGSLPLLQEAVLKNVFMSLRADIQKTAYASYWAELIYLWSEEYEEQPELYELFIYTLDALDKGIIRNAELNILFQIKFLKISGLFPVLEHCLVCGCSLACISDHGIFFDLSAGCSICSKCRNPGSQLFISRKTLEYLAWIDKHELLPEKSEFSQQSVHESQIFLETFIPYHLGRTPRSLNFLQQIRNNNQ